MIFILCFVALFALLIFFMKNSLAKRKTVRYFQDGNVVVTGLRGRGKDTLFNFVINARKKEYISNVYYGHEDRWIDFFPLRQMTLGGNTSEHFISGRVRPYKYPYEDGIDYYISDAQLYFPSQDYARLNNDYPQLPLFEALSRHVGACNVHCNTQNLNRIWDKFREQSDTYLMCVRCRYFGRLVRLKYYAYDKYDSCVSRVKPMKRRWGKNARVEFDKFQAAYGTVEKVVIWFLSPFRYDDRRFKTLMEEKYEQKNNAS